MKNKLILAGIITLNLNGYAQQWNGSSSSSGSIYRSGRVGVFNSSPVYGLDVISQFSGDGIRVKQTNYGTCGAKFENSSAGGRNWALLSTGAQDVNPGDFIIEDQTSVKLRMIINGATGNVGMGMPVTPGAHSRLEVLNEITPPGQGIHKRAVWGRAVTSTPVTGGGAVHVSVGVEGNAMGYENDCFATGVYGKAENTMLNIGGDFLGIGNGYYDNIGVRGEAYGNSSWWKNWAGYFAGNTYCTGSYQTSDMKLKTDIKPLTNALEKIMLLKPSTYTFKTEEFNKMHLPQGNQIGLIAQELEKVFPELIAEMSENVKYNEKGEKQILNPAFKSIQYTSLIPVLISGMQEQQKQIEEQKVLIAELQNKSGSKPTGIYDIDGGSGFRMEQNEPNPFSSETKINFTMPPAVASAALIIYDLTGKQINKLPITERGSSSITITSENLAAGIYIYSIVADNKIVDTKRMVVTEK